MSDPLETFLAGVAALVSSAFGAGIAFATLRGQVQVAKLAAASAQDSAQDALRRLAEERTRSTRQDGDLRLFDERIANLRGDVDALNAAVFQSRIRSPSGPMSAVRAPRPDIPRQDSDPVPPYRPAAKSFRRNDT